MMPEKQKPLPKCPCCGQAMSLRVGDVGIWYGCPDCETTSPLANSREEALDKAMRLAKKE